jgi:CheY-like chemotaxis protein
VEDDADDFMLLKRALWKAGATARVWWARDAQEALSILAEVSGPASHVCVVLDVQLPGCSGFDLLDQIKAAQAGSKVKVAFLTGFSDARTVQRVQAQAADAFFTKPVDPAGLIQVARDLQRLAAS